MIGIDIDMPKECDECIFCTNKINNDYGYYGQCFICKDLRIDLLMHKKGKKCPLVELKGEQ